MSVLLNRKLALLLLAVVVVAGTLVYYSIPAVRIEKRDLEIDRILRKQYKFDRCVQYALVALSDGYYPCYQCADGMIFLKKMQVWKYGKTCIGEQKRYPDGLISKRLLFLPQYFGTEQECLVEEKRKIYDYPNLPECRSRKIHLLRPPGNKIDR